MAQRKNSIVPRYFEDIRKSRRKSCRQAGPENVPVEGDCPRPVGASQEIFEVQNDLNGVWPVPARPSLGRIRFY